MNGKLFFVILLCLPLFLFAANNCLQYDASDDFVRIPTLLSGTTYSVSAWFKTSDLTSARGIFAQRSNSASQPIMGQIYTTSTTINFITRDNAGGHTALAAGTTLLETGVWYHVVGVRNGANIVLYLNGEQEATDNDAGGTITTNVTDIGRYTYGSTSVGGFFGGYIDNVRIYNRALTATEVDDLYESEVSGSTDGLVAYWKFDEGTGQTIGDSKGSNDGTRGINDVVSTDDPSWVTSDAPLPVTLSSFTAFYSNGLPHLSWTTQSESNNLGWNVYRSENNELFGSVQINDQYIAGAGNSAIPTHYDYQDEEILNFGSEYYYWLESISVSGESGFHGPISLMISDEQPEDETPEFTKEFGLYPNYPNPFNPSTTISFSLKIGCKCDLEIYDVKGRKVINLFSGNVNSEELKTVVWDGTDNGGKFVAAGIYFYRLSAGEIIQHRKMILMK